MDASVYAPVTAMLRLLGWDVESAEQAGLTGKIDDVKWVIHARKCNRVGVTFDELRARQGEKVSRELRRHGGKVLRINGAYNPFRAIGKLLYHYSDWHPFLRNNDGVSVLSDVRPQGCKNYTPEEYHLHYHRIDAVLFAGYLEKRKSRPYRPRKRKYCPPPEDQSTFI